MDVIIMCYFVYVLIYVFLSLIICFHTGSTVNKIWLYYVLVCHLSSVNTMVLVYRLLWNLWDSNKACFQTRTSKVPKRVFSACGAYFSNNFDDFFSLCLQKFSLHSMPTYFVWLLLFQDIRVSKWGQHPKFWIIVLSPILICFFLFEFLMKFLTCIMQTVLS